MPLHSIFDFSVSCASEERRGGAFLPCRVELARRSRIREKITIRPDDRRSKLHHSCCIVSFTPSLAPPYTIYVEPRQNHDSPGDLKFVKKSRFARTVEGPGEWTSHITSAKRHLNIISTSRIMWNRRSSSAGFFVSSLRFSDELLPSSSPRLSFLCLCLRCACFTVNSLFLVKR